MKAKPQNKFCGPLVFSVTVAGFKELDNIHRNSWEWLSRIRIDGRTAAYGVAFLKVKISSVHLIKFTEAAALETSW